MNENMCCFTFSGYCAAAAASEILNREHIENRIIKAPVYMNRSCGFAVVIKKDDEEKSCIALDREKISTDLRTFI